MLWEITFFLFLFLLFIGHTLRIGDGTTRKSRAHKWGISFRRLLSVLVVIVLGPLLLWLSYGFAEYLFILLPDRLGDEFFYLGGLNSKPDYNPLRPILLGGFMLIGAVAVHAAGGIARDYLNRDYYKRKN